MSATVQAGFERWTDDEARRIELPYKPFPKQQEFHSCPAKYRLFGGAAGPGKSMALLMEAILQANEHAGVSTLLMRRTFAELESSLITYFRRDVPQSLYRSYNSSKHVVEWWNGSNTRFGYSQNEHDVYQYQGAEFLFIGIDEVTHFTLRQWQFLTSRNRCPVPNSFPCMAGASNPGNIGHPWVKALWIEKKAAPGMESPEQYDPSDYAFIAALIWDNPVYANDQAYLKTLRSLPSELRKALLEGNWDIFAGQYFDILDRRRHEVRAELVGLQPWWPRWVSIDWGFEHPAAAYWHTTAPAIGPRETQAALPRRVVTYREFVKQHLNPRVLAEEILERSRGVGTVPGQQDLERVDAIYLSPDAYARRTDEASIAEQMGDVFARAGWPRPTPADNDRVAGWMLMYQLLQGEPYGDAATGGYGPAEWQITDACPELFASLSSLTRDPAYVEDVLKVEGDDPADAARYGLKTHLRDRKRSAPLATRVAERVTSLDNTIRAMQAQKALFDENKKHQPVFFRRRGPHRPHGAR